MAVFRRSFYCDLNSGSLVCIGAPAIGAGPLNAICALPDETDWRNGGVLPGAEVECDGEVLRIDGRFVFPYRDASIWRPPLPRQKLNREDLVRGLACLGTECRTRAPVDGFAPLIVPLTDPQPRAPQWLVPTNPLLKMAWEGIVGLSDWLEASLLGDEVASTTRRPDLESLIGLGPGLTPSGDDFLGGVMIALHAMGRPMIAERLAGWILPTARGRTSSISYAHLACAAEGEGAEALHEMLMQLFHPEPPRFREHLDDVDAIGHSSGWDALAGFAAASAAVVRSSNTPVIPHEHTIGAERCR